MIKKSTGQIILDIKNAVIKEVFGESLPAKKYPEDFLSEKAKKELAIPISYPALKMGTKITGKEHRIRRGKPNIKNIMEVQDAVKRFEETSTSSYEEILVPAADSTHSTNSGQAGSPQADSTGSPQGEGKLKIGDLKKKVQVCLENGQVICELDSLAKAKYLIYSKKKGQVIYKVPKSEIVVKKAVEAFEKDREKIIDKLTEAFEKRNADEDLAHHLALQVMEEIGLK